MIKGDTNKLIQSSIRQLIDRIPHSLNQEQEKMVLMICQEIVNTVVEQIDKTPAETKAEQELLKIKNTWKELNKLLK